MRIISKLLITLMYLFSFDLLLGTCLLWMASFSQWMDKSSEFFWLGHQELSININISFVSFIGIWLQQSPRLYWVI